MLSKKFLTAVENTKVIFDDDDGKVYHAKNLYMIWC